MALLELLSIICVFELSLTWFVLIDQFVYESFDDCGPAIIGILLLIAYGAFASLYTARDDTRFGNRRERMKNQCGHTAMLLYFWGLGPLTELIQVFRNTGTKINLYKACKHHIFVSTIIQTLIRLFLLHTYQQVYFITIIICLLCLTLLAIVKIIGYT